MSEQALKPEATRHSCAAVLEAVEKGTTLLGTARVLGCSRTTVRRYRHRWPSVDAALKEKREELVDLAESALRLAVIDREPWAVSLVLKTLGRGDGYTERHEVSVETTAVDPWPEIRSAMLTVLSDYPEARLAVAGRLAEMEAS